MRVPFVHSFYSGRSPSGENRIVLDEIDALRSAGVEVELFSANTDELEHGHTYKARSAWRVASGFGSNPLSTVSRFKPQVIQVHNLFPNFGSRWLRRVSAPVVVTLHNFRTVCANGFCLRAGHPCTKCLDQGSHHAVRFGCYRGSRLASVPLAISTAGPAHRHPLLANASAVRVLNPVLGNLLERGGMPAEILVPWSNFLPDALDPGGRVVSGSGSLFVGRLSEEKGVRRLVEAWPKDGALRIVGEGPLRGFLEEAAGGRPITVEGPLDRDRVLRTMTRAEWLVFPSVWFEGAPLVYAEALASGLPVAACAPSSVASRVAEEGTGVVFDSPEQMAEGLPKAHAPSSEDVRAVFESRYSQAAFVAKSISQYERLVETAKSQ